MMKRILVLVEGQTEEQFVKEVLAPHLWEKFEVGITPTIIATKRVKQGRDFRGGILSFNQVRRDILLTLKDTNAALITTMIDFYGLPADFPGRRTATGSARERAEFIERAVNERIGSARFRAYLVLHEFEGMLFSHPGRLAGLMGQPDKEAEITAVAEAFETPEEINDSPQTAPSKRLKVLFPGFQKTLHGPLAALELTLPVIRGKCPRFNAWLTTLESVALNE